MPDIQYTKFLPPRPILCLLINRLQFSEPAVHVPLIYAEDGQVCTALQDNWVILWKSRSRFRSACLVSYESLDPRPRFSRMLWPGDRTLPVIVGVLIGRRGSLGPTDEIAR